MSPLARSATGLPEPGYELLVDLIDARRRLDELVVLPDPSRLEVFERARLEDRIPRMEVVLPILIEVQRILGVETWLPP